MGYRGIIFSGLPGAGKSYLAQKLAAVYNWPMVSVGDLWRKRYDEWAGRNITFEEYWRSVSDADNQAMDRQAEKIFSKGAIIGEGRFVKNLQKYPLLLVFVTADIDTRAKFKKDSGKYAGQTVEQIKEILAAREQDELKVGQKLYGYDYRDPAIYHFVLNSSMMPAGEEINIIESLVLRER